MALIYRILAKFLHGTDTMSLLLIIADFSKVINRLHFVDPVALTLDSTHNGLKSIMISSFSQMQLKKSYDLEKMKKYERPTNKNATPEYFQPPSAT